MPRKARPPRGQWEHTSAQAVAAAAAAAARKPVRARGGTSFVRLPNRVGAYSCGPVSLLQLMLWRAQVPVDEIIHSTNGCNIPSHVVDFVQYIRDITVETSAVHPDFEWCDPDGGDEMLRINELANCPNRDILTKEVWDKIMRWMCGYFDGRALKIGADAFGLDALVIVKLDSDGFLVPVDGMLTSIVDAQNLVFWDGYSHFEALVPEEEFYPVFPNVGKGFFFDVSNEELPPVPDIAEDWEQYLLTSRTNTPGTERGGPATTRYSADVAGVEGVAGVAQTPFSWLSALLVVMVFAHYPLFPSIIEALEFVIVFTRCALLRGIMAILEFVVVLSRCIRSVIGTWMVRKEVAADTWYTGFTIRVPDKSHRCRLVRGRRYRNGTTGGLHREQLRKAFTAVRRFLTQMNPPPESPRRTTTQSFVLGAMYTASATASALAYGFAVASILFAAMFTWATIGSFLFPVDLSCDRATDVDTAPVDHARDEATGVDTPTATRIEADSYLMGGRRRGPCRDKTRCRYGRRRGNKGYLEKQLKKVEKKETERAKKQERVQQRKYEMGLASVRGGEDPPEAYGRGKRKGRTQKRSRVRDHLYFVEKEAAIKHKVATDPDWKQEHLDKWRTDTKDERMEQENIFKREQNELKKREQDEARERERQERENGEDDACQFCGEVGDLSDTDVIDVCEGDGCSVIIHSMCREEDPSGKWVCGDCMERGRVELPDVDDGTGGAGEDDDDPMESSSPSPPSSQGDTGLLAGADGGAGDVALPDADGGTGLASPPLDAGGQVQPKAKPRKRGGGNPAICQLRLPQHFNKSTSLIWRCGKGVGVDLFKKLRDNYAKAAAKMKEIAEKRPDTDNRTLTLKQIEEALSDPGGKAFRGVIDKLEKFDYKLYGIKVQGGGEDGTKVKHAKTSATGTVRSFFLDDDGYNGFVIGWDKCDAQSRYTTREVLEGAERYGGHQGVTSPSKDDERVLLFLRAVLCMVNVQVRRFVLVDDKKTKQWRAAVDLAPDDKKKVMSIRETAWEIIKKAKLTDTMTENEKSLLGQASGKLLDEAGCTGSLLEALGLDHYENVNDIGFVESTKAFHERQMTFVNHFVRGAQTSWKLGRPTSVESCIAPLSAGTSDGVPSRGAVDELSDPLYLMDHERTKTIYTADSKKIRKCGLGVRLLLARAKVSTAGSKGHDCFKWWTHCPLYKQFDFTRSSRMGQVSATTEHTGRANQVRRNEEFYSSVLKYNSSKSSRKRDSSVLKEIFDAYEPVAQQKRNDAAAHENNLARIGHGSKVNSGRTMGQWEGECKFLGTLVKECGIDPVMQKIGDAGRQKEVIAMCMKVLRDGDGLTIGTRVDENHLYPEEHRESIDEVVDVLAKAGVSAQDLERFSGALHILDSLTSACLRPQDSLGCLACRAYIKNGRLVFRLPDVAKNSRTLLRSAAGMVVNHVKAEITTGPFVVMLVIGRRLMRLRLKEDYQKACDKLERERTKYEADKGQGGRRAADAKKRVDSAETEVKRYAPKAIDRKARADRVTSARQVKPEVFRDVELGDKAAPFTKYGKNYTSHQLLSMYKHVGQYALGLPAFGPNILRTIHVTTVMTVCYRLNISVDDQCVKDHFALARHGEYEMQRSYNLVKRDNLEYDPDSFTARVSGIISSQDLLRDGQSPDFQAKKKAALKECFGDSLSNALERQEGDSFVEKKMREIMVYVEDIARRVPTQNITWTPETEALENKKRQAELTLQIAKLEAETREVQIKSGRSVSAGVASHQSIPRVDESLESGLKRGHDESVGVSCKRVDGDSGRANKRAKRGTGRAKRGTWSAESMQLLHRMNVIFNEKAVEMKLDLSKKYLRTTLENAIVNADSFKKLVTERIISYLQQKCEDNADVKVFYDLNPSGKNIDDVIRKARALGQPTEWSDWFCRTCNKVDCGCPN